MFYNAVRNTFSKWERVGLRMKVADIPIVNQYKWLGITLDKRLSGNIHIQSIKEKVKKYTKLITILKF